MVNKKLELGSKTSGLENKEFIAKKSITDFDISKDLEILKTEEEKKNYLKEILHDLPTGLVRSKIKLANYIKHEDPIFSCKLMLSCCLFYPFDYEPYLIFSEIALENHAFVIAESILEVAYWLCNDEDRLAKIKTLKEKCAIDKNKFNDISSDEIWKTMHLRKYWVLERIYYQADKKNLLKISKDLLGKYPLVLENYFDVFKIFSQVEDEKFFLELQTMVNQAPSEVDKKLLNGMIAYELNDFENAVVLLTDVVNESPISQKGQIYLGLCYLMKDEIEKFVLSGDKILPSSELITLAVYFLSSAAVGYNLKQSEFPNQNNISEEISRILKKLYKNNMHIIANYLIEQFCNNDYFVILPSLRFFLAEVLIKENNLDMAKHLVDNCDDVEAHRINAWIYRLEGEDEKAKKELIQYRGELKFLDGEKTGVLCKAISFDYPEVPTEINSAFNVLNNLYEQCSKFTKEIDMEYGINPMTCIEANCNDCCTKTFPYSSFSEYVYLYKWIEKESPDFLEKMIVRSKEIVKNFTEKYGREPEIVLGDEKTVGEIYPKDFLFNCPALENNLCKVHKGRPFTCRSYAYGTMDGIRLKSCDFFFEQYKMVTKLHEVRKVINMNEFSGYVREIDINLVGAKALAPIPVWFSRTIEENMKKIQSSSIAKS